MAIILIVDDIEDNLQLLRFNLEDDGHTVISATGGEDCLTLARKHRPDLILLDLMMPGMSGTETLAQLKGETTLSDIPVIMISANDNDDAVVRALDIGANEYVTKPFNYRVLAARIRTALRLREAQKQLQELNDKLARLASTDPLTGVFNRRYFLELGSAEFAKARRHQRQMSVIVLDADNFKSINDSYGHAGGDAALKQLTRLCRAVGRQGDLIGRFGGEEFVICCPETDLEGARQLAERLRLQVESSELLFDGQPIRFTVSLGVTAMSGDDTAIDDMLRRADRLLYRAKAGGRNQFCS